MHRPTSTRHGGTSRTAGARTTRTASGLVQRAAGDGRTGTRSLRHARTRLTWNRGRWPRLANAIENFLIRRNHRTSGGPPDERAVRSTRSTRTGRTALRRARRCGRSRTGWALLRRSWRSRTRRWRTRCTRRDRHGSCFCSTSLRIGRRQRLTRPRDHLSRPVDRNISTRDHSRSWRSGDRRPGWTGLLRH